MVKLFLGGIRPLPPDNQPTGIFKLECPKEVWLGREGLIGDAQADRRVHGGPEKALHQYPVAHYARLAAAFPDAAAALAPSSMGENLSVPGWTEADLCIGDVFRLGDARIQVSQPRLPCWKIDHRFGIEGAPQLIEAEGITGWYFRVIEEGTVAPGCTFELLERTAPTMTVAEVWRLWKAHRPEPAALDAVAATPGLSPNWIKRFVERADWLRTHAR